MEQHKANRIYHQFRAESFISRFERSPDKWRWEIHLLNWQGFCHECGFGRRSYAERFLSLHGCFPVWRSVFGRTRYHCCRYKSSGLALKRTSSSLYRTVTLLTIADGKKICHAQPTRVWAMTVVHQLSPPGPAWIPFLARCMEEWLK